MAWQGRAVVQKLRTKHNKKLIVDVDVDVDASPTFNMNGVCSKWKMIVLF